MSGPKYWQAINRALGDEMEADDTVIVLGEDVGAAGGPFGASKGLLERFGASRVRDTPISEAAMVGAALGASMAGARPVVEVMFMDFLTLAMDQLVNQAAKVSYMSGGSFHAPMVVRTQCGAGRGTGPQHSQSFDGWLANVPGLKVVWPSCPRDAYHLLRAAIQDPNPVVVIESLSLWTSRADFDDFDEPCAPLGEAAVRRMGRDVTAVAWGGVVNRTMEAAGICAQMGIDVEVIDLRSLSPLDEQAILRSIDKTGRLAVIEDGPGHVSIGARIGSLAASSGYRSLTAPVCRIGSPFAPVPFPPMLMEAYYPSANDIAGRVSSMVREE